MNQGKVIANVHERYFAMVLKECFFNEEITNRYMIGIQNAAMDFVRNANPVRIPAIITPCAYFLCARYMTEIPKNVNSASVVPWVEIKEKSYVRINENKSGNVMIFLIL
jgi:hypothetical protein